MTLGQRLATIRELAHLTLREAGRRSGVDYSVIARYEADAITPGSRNLAALAKLYGVSMDELFYGSGWCAELEVSR